MEEKKSNVGIVICIIIIILLLATIGGMYYYYNYMDDSKTQTNKDIITKTDEISVIDGIDYTVNDRRIKIPQIINGGKNSIELNKEIASKTLEKTYNMVGIQDENIGIESTYNYKIQNKILVIATKIQYDQWSASGDGIFRFNFFYDIEKDKILTMYEVLPLLGYTLEDIKESGANSFENFKITENIIDTDGSIYETYITIEDGKIKINYKVPTM